MSATCGHSRRYLINTGYDNPTHPVQLALYLDARPDLGRDVYGRRDRA